MKRSSRASYFLLAALSVLGACLLLVIAKDMRAKGQGVADAVEQSPTVGLVASNPGDEEAASIRFTDVEDLRCGMKAGVLASEVTEDGRLRVATSVDVYNRDGDANYVWALHIFGDPGHKILESNHFYRDAVFDLGVDSESQVSFEEFLSLQPGTHYLSVSLVLISKNDDVNLLEDSAFDRKPRVTACAAVTVQ